MRKKNRHTRHHHARSTPSGLAISSLFLTVSLWAGCQTTSREKRAAAEVAVEQTYAIQYLNSTQCEALLSPLSLERIAHAPPEEGNAVIVRGTPEQLQRVKAILDLADSPEQYGLERLGSATSVRSLPSNGQIAAALGNIDIGTFDEPPVKAARPRGIIDIQGDAVVALLPTRYLARLQALLAPEGSAARVRKALPIPGRPGVAAEPASGPVEPNQAVAAVTEGPRVVTLVQMADPCDARASGTTGASSPPEAQPKDEPPKTVRISFAPASRGPEEARPRTMTDKALPANAEDVLKMTLPETITLIQLLDLVGKHVGLNCVYDPRELPNQPIALKLNGNLQGELKVKSLYALLETVLDFNGLAMIRQEENLVAVVPMAKALQTQPELVDPNFGAVEVGDTVVTRVFDIQHADVTSVITLLENMKLSVAATPLDSSTLLLVTCLAGRMNRIEELVEMIDHPGRPAECRFRRLSYVRATPLIAKVRSLAEELKGITVATAAPTATARPATPALPRPPTVARPTAPAERQPVYLDTDERTNRILMIGFEEELTLVEELIDVLDVAQDDPRAPHIYTVKHLSAQQALEKLEKLEVLKTIARSGGPAGAAGAQAAGGDPLADEPLVAVLEATNQLVVKAAPDQHVRIREFLTYVDVTPTDTRTIAAYELRHIDVQAAKEALEELDVVSVDTTGPSFVSGPNQPAGLDRKIVPVAKTNTDPLHQASMVVSESTNSLLVKATPEQHARIASIVRYIDRYTPEEQLAYEVYPLESSSPDHLAGLLERLILETTTDAEGKIERITPRTKDRITVVPDPNTFSLIVYASQKNQQWIEGLIARLDKRRPQVLIDVTLVEITRTDSFEYDLSLVAAANGAVTGNLVIDPIQTLDSGTRLEGGFNLLDSEGNPTGRTRAFYSDRHVQALLTAIQQKNYGRVLAKPKVLVDDGREGQIMTTEATTYVKESIQIPEVGIPITTREFVPIEASIELQITPHISEGNILRLDVFMSRDDFGARPLSGAPPDKATSTVTTTVFVPDDRTVILGGLVKLNQSKGGSKVPILGDLPLIGALFRNVNNSDIERKLYVFLKANIVRPYDDLGLTDLHRISEEHREAFERSESKFQGHQDIPGITPQPMEPEGVLRGYK